MAHMPESDYVKATGPDKPVKTVQDLWDQTYGRYEDEAKVTGKIGVGKPPPQETPFKLGGGA